MKKLLILFVLVVLILTVSSVSLAKSSITINPFGALFGFYDAQYELQLGKNAGMIIGGRFFNYEIESSSLTGIGGRLGVRAYPTGEFNGLFLQGDGGVNTVSVSDSIDTVSGTAFNVEGQAGFKWASDNGFTFEFGIGEVYTMTQVEGAKNGFSTIIVLNVGYTF